MIKEDKIKWLDRPGLIVLGGLVTALIAYAYLPERVPMHWNFSGQVDNYGSRFTGAFGIPLLSLGLYVLFVLLPLLDPRRANYEKFRTSYRLIIVAILLFLFALQILVILFAIGYPVSIGKVVTAGIALLFTVIGNVQGRIKPNYFIGIRTPWTLASEEVWRVTHRRTAWAWVAGGIAGIPIALFLPEPVGGILAVALVLGAAIYSVVYSYLNYKQRGL